MLANRTFDGTAAAAVAVGFIAIFSTVAASIGCAHTGVAVAIAALAIGVDDAAHGRPTLALVSDASVGGGGNAGATTVDVAFARVLDAVAAMIGGADVCSHVAKAALTICSNRAALATRAVAAAAAAAVNVGLSSIFDVIGTRVGQVWDHGKVRHRSQIGHQIADRHWRVGSHGHVTAATWVALVVRAAALPRRAIAFGRAH